MSEKTNQEPEHTDWNRVEARMMSREVSSLETEQVAYQFERKKGDSDHSIVPTPMTVPTLDTETSRGILMKFKMNQISKKTAIDAIQAKYNAQLDTLRYQLRKAVTVSNARADRIAEEFLKKLDSEHIQVLKDLGLRNADTRATALIEVREMIAAKLKEVQTKNWPKPLVDRTIDDLIDLEKRVCAEMMKELGQ